MPMKPVDMSEAYWGVNPDDPAVTRAMEVYDHLDDIERSNVYRSMILAMVAYRRTGQSTYLTDNLTDGVDRMIRMDAVPGFREKLRASRTSTPVPASDTDVQALLQMLEDGIA